jgi:cytochrome c oxidase subunit 2
MGPDQRRSSRRLAIQMIVVGVIASAMGIALGLAIDWFPTQASTQAPKIDDLYDVMIIASVPVFVLVQVVVLFSVWKFRMRPGEELKDGPPIHGNTRLEVIWTAIPAIIIVGLCSYAYAVLRDIEKKPANEIKVGVTGRQFAWSFTYPPDLTGGKAVNATQLYLPKGRSVEFQIRAKDVIHDFWVPAFRLKVDAVPGITTKYRVTPSRVGTYPGVCAELCGPGHSTMRVPVHVIEPDAFQRWLERQVAVAAAGGGGGQASTTGGSS